MRFRNQNRKVQKVESVIRSLETIASSRINHDVVVGWTCRKMSNSINNTELNYLRTIICLRKSEFYV